MRAMLCGQICALFDTSVVLNSASIVYLRSCRTSNPVRNTLAALFCVSPILLFLRVRSLCNAHSFHVILNGLSGVVTLLPVTLEMNSATAGSGFEVGIKKITCYHMMALQCSRHPHLV